MKHEKMKPGVLYFLGAGTDAHSQRMLEGVIEHQLSLMPARQVHWGPGLPVDEILRKTRVIGVICFGISPEHRRRLRRLKIPIVKVGSRLASTGLSQVLPDNQAIGRMAAKHFQELYYRDLAFVGHNEHLYSCERLAGFQEGCGEVPVYVFDGGQDKEVLHKNYDDQLRGFLRKLPPRCAIFAANDIFARKVSHLLHEMDIRIPQDRALLGVDNDHLCLVSSPVGISSIDPNSIEIGRQAAVRLEELIAGAEDDASLRRIPPLGVVSRASTEWLATEDERMVDVLLAIKHEACAGLDVENLCKRFGIGRRSLERRFHAVTGQSPDKAIRQIRILRAAQLMATTHLQIGEICLQTGFEDALYFSKSFRKATGVSPRAWRKLPAGDRPQPSV